MSAQPDIHYWPRGRVAGHRVGAHPSRGLGSLGEFRDEVPFMVHPDARRIDVRATLRDPFETTYVRRSRPRVAVDLYAIVDLTASLGVGGRAGKRELVAALCSALAASATRGGDRFGLVGCDTAVREECVVPASGRRGIAAEVEARLAATRCDGRAATGLSAAAALLAGRRKMVFLVSDFFLPLALLRQTFESLAAHDVVPVVIADSSEDRDLPDWGLLDLLDPETGMRRLVAMRPALKRRWIEAEARRRGEVRRLAAEFGRAPVTITDVFDADAFSRHLLES